MCWARKLPFSIAGIYITNKIIPYSGWDDHSQYKDFRPWHMRNSHEMLPTKNLKNVNSLRITGARLLCRYSTHHGCRRLWSSDGSDDFAAVLRWANGSNKRFGDLVGGMPSMPPLGFFRANKNRFGTSSWNLRLAINRLTFLMMTF